jgi:hypothetical protein
MVVELKFKIKPACPGDQPGIRHDRNGGGKGRRFVGKTALNKIAVSLWEGGSPAYSLVLQKKEQWNTDNWGVRVSACPY